MSKAVAVLQGDNGLKVVAHFTQPSADGKTTISVEGSNIKPGLHGFHIHEFGDTTNGCISAGGHFNPLGKNHGDRDAAERHVGDLGNVSVGEDGVLKVTFEDHLISLAGDRSILGRALVLHADADDLGKGGDQNSLLNGNAGARIACGIVGLTKADPPRPTSQL